MRTSTFAIAASVLALSSCLPSLVVGTQMQNSSSEATTASAASDGAGQAPTTAANSQVATAAAPGQDIPSTLNCSTYTNANAANATCNDDSTRVCSGKCTGAVSIDKCSLKPETGPFSEEKCTISYGKSSATIYICINEKGSFTCTGKSKGSATCLGCATKGGNGTSGSSSNTTTSGGNGSSPSSGDGSNNGTSTASGSGSSSDKPASASRLVLAGPLVGTTGLLAGLLFF